MAKATLTLPSGTVVNVEGTTEEVQALLTFYGGATERVPTGRAKASSRPRRGKNAAVKPQPESSSGAVDLSEIVNLVKNCDEAEAIERQVLDRTSQVNRTLLPLYIVHDHLKNAFGLSSGDISKITTDLGVPVSRSNASTTLSGTASKYVIGDRVRRKGHPVKYKLSRRGSQYMRSVIGGTAGEDEG